MVIAQCRWLSARRKEPDDIAKLAIGSAIISLAYIIISAVSFFCRGDVAIVWVVLFFAILDFGFLWIWIFTLSAVSRISPVGMKSTMLGIVFLMLFFGNMIVGFLAQFYDPAAPEHYWAIQALIAAAGACVIFSVRPRLRKGLGRAI